MPININGTTGISGADGSAATPAIQGADTNTGIFFPAADTVAVSTGGSERARIDSSGNLGVGTTSPQATIVAAGSNATVYKAMILRNSNGSDGSSATIDFETSAGTQGIEAAMAGRIAGLRIGSGTSGALTFSTTSGGTLAERARIDSSGNLLVGKTAANTGSDGVQLTTTSGGRISSSATTADCATFNRNGNDGSLILMLRGGGIVGSISVTTTATAYNTSSDYRLKHDIQPMAGALAKVAALKPVTYKWNVDNSDGEGFIAHELQAVIPGCVTGEKDAVDADGNPVYQGIDTSFLVATLTAAIQELKAIVDAQAVEIAALKGAA